MELRRTSGRRWIIIILLIVAVVGLFGWFSLHKVQQKPNYITALAEQRDLQQTVLADGKITASKQVSVGAQASGQIKSLQVTLGQQIKQGQLIAEIDNLTQQNELRNAQAALKNIQAQRAAKQAILANYNAAFLRQKAMLAKNLTAKADYDAALANLNSTQADIHALDAQIVQSQIQVDTAQVNLGYSQILSPIDGTVVSIPVEEGQTVNAVQSAPTIVKVANLNTMTVKAQISEADVVNVRPGMQVWFTILGQPNKRYSATLRAIEPAPDSINTDSSLSASSGSSASASSSSEAIYYYGLFDIANPQHTLRISMTAEVHIVLGDHPNAIVIPSTALDAVNGKTSVQVVDNQQQVARREVTVGINNNIEAQITAGLKAGERVIISQGAASDATPPAGM
ncbi:efflux RND transporter periplasmic adaptor subunit [Erwiniaceae bacterium BAC15a-03b]|uniref:Efflux RND transporter periplasmic adaptor subunit n=1 Tax=Winslowiella arboricola TaxID=2978220 RepID=A0A9J6PFY4_9GAMM|nr:efflux RND transporter periplasmic adaptor subunit [Winslowiella arboricola]MCU5771339.1 efflux RND transporter periplasmic adaptor subunit [Winslowiella arboricola]MCU5777209.1 efflux RND transporter periplasmic adaptor subunit [Winslowiella arboricola]